MPEIRLGPAGQEIKLPAPRYRSALSWPIHIQRNIDRRVMADGSARYNFRPVELRRWPFIWDLLTRAELDDFLWLSRFKTKLRFQNTWDDETWYTVVMTTFDYEPLVDVHTDEVRYMVRLTLEEVK